MSLMLPPEVRGFCSAIGYPFPDSDDQGLLNLAQVWSRQSAPLDGHVGQLSQAAARAWSGGSSGEFLTEFQRGFTGDSGPVVRITGGAAGADIVAAGLMVCAGIVVALKISVIVQVVMTLVAIAAALTATIATGGASAALIVAFREACRRVLDYLTDVAVGRVLFG